MATISEPVFELGAGQKALPPDQFFAALLPLTRARTQTSTHGQEERYTCQVRITETLTLTDGHIHRYFVTDGDIVVERRTFDAANVLESWLTAENGGLVASTHLCAIARLPDRSVRVLDGDSLQRLIAHVRAHTHGTGRDSTAADSKDEFVQGLPGILALQRFLTSKGGDRAVYRVACEAAGTRGNRPDMTITRATEVLTAEGYRDRSEFAPVPSYNTVINAALENMAARLVAQVELATTRIVARAVLEFLVDERERPWFLWPRHVLTKDPAELTSLPVAATAVSTATVPAAGAAALAARRYSLPTELAASPDELTPLDVTKQEYKALVGTTVGSGARGHILLVDSDPVATVSACSRLREAGFAITVTDDGPRALALTRSSAFDCMIVARDLPTFSGLEVTRIIRQREAMHEQPQRASAPGTPATADARLPILAFTDQCEPEDLRTYREVGMNGCVSKPVMEDALLRVVAAAVPMPTRSVRGKTVPSTPLIATRSLSPSEAAAGLTWTGAQSNPAGESRNLASTTPADAMPSSTAPTAVDTALARTRETDTSRGNTSPYAKPTLPPVSSSATRAGRSARRRSTSKEMRIVAVEHVDEPRSASAKRPVTGGIHGGRLGQGAGLPMLEPGAVSVSATAAQSGTAFDDAVTGVFRLDVDTEMPYCALGVDQPGSAFFHMIVVNDIFDTYERYQIFFRRMTRKMPGLRVLLFNLPGQAYTRFRRDTVLTAEYLAGCVQALLVHVGSAGNSVFALDGGTAPFYMIGYGYGAAVASAFAIQYVDAYPHMRGLVHMNGFSYIDSHLAGVLHDCVNVFSCTPPQRPDLPVYFHARFLFSPAYLAKIGAALALNLYTAVANPISIDGRIALAQGAMETSSLLQGLAALDLPLILVVSTKDGFVEPAQTKSLATRRGGEQRSIRRALYSRKGAAIVSLLCGHEVWQEAKAAVLTLLYQLATGYHERNDVAFLPLDDADVALLMDDEDKRAVESSTVRLVTDPATMSLTRPMGAHARSELQARSAAHLAPPPPMLEDRFLDHVVSTMRDPAALERFNGTAAPPVTSASPLVRAAAPAAARAISTTTMVASPHPSLLMEAPRPAETIGTSADRLHPTSSSILAALLPGLGIGVTTIKSGGPTLKAPPDRMTLSNSRYRVPKARAHNTPRSGLPPIKRLDSSEVNRVTAALAKGASRDSNPLRVSRVLLRSTTPGDASKPGSRRRSGDALAATKPDLQEYMAWRIRRNQRRLNRLEAAAVSIQRAFRAFLSRSAVRRVIMTRAALDVQSWWRGELARRYVRELRRVMEAIVSVQRVYRGYRARVRYTHMKAEVRAAVNIQRIFRGYLARRYVENLKRYLHHAATKIQSAYRRYAAIRELVRRRIERVAAITIQRIARGMLGRRRATRERDRFLFSKSQAQGIEFGRQMLMEHKMLATRLQSEVAVLSKEKITAEETISAVLAEISSLEQGVRALERDMLQLAQADAEIASVLDDAARVELREQKIRLDREFARLLAKITDRKEKLTAQEAKLQAVDRARETKRIELKELERRLVVLLDQQHSEIAAIRQRQDIRGEHMIEDTVQAVQSAMGVQGRDASLALLTDGPTVLALEDAPGTVVPFKRGAGTALAVSQSGRTGSTIQFDDLPAAPGSHMSAARGGVVAGGPTAQQRAEAAALMASTETMMKFGFMSMSLTYFSAINMVRAMRQVGAANTMLATDPMLQMVGQLGTAGAAGALPMPPPVGASIVDVSQPSSQFRPRPKPGELPGQQNVSPTLWTVGDVSAWLESLSLGQYKDAFADAAVDGAFLLELTEDDLLNTLGVEHALHRKKLVTSIIRLARGGSAPGAAAAAPQAVQDSFTISAAPGAPAAAAPLSIDTALVQSTYQPASPVRSAYRAGGAAGAPAPALMNAPIAASSSLRDREQQRLEETRQQAVSRDVVTIKLEEMISWIRNNKMKQVAEALAPLPDGHFDAANVKNAFVPTFGTEYADRLNGPAFHVNKADEHGNTLLIVACQNGRMKIAQLLIRKGANPNHQNASGNTAAHFAYTYKFWDLAAWLMDPEKGGANDGILNEFGNTPYDGLE